MHILIGLVALPVMLVILTALYAVPGVVIAYYGLGHYRAVDPRPHARSVDPRVRAREVDPHAHVMAAKPAPLVLYGLGIPEGYVQPAPPADNWLRAGDTYGSDK